jgi:MoxR-like ATPase
MKLSQQIADAFERYCLEYFQKDFSKHKNYLLKVAFGRNSSIISIKHFDEAILIYATDPNRGVRELYNVLQSAIEATMQPVEEKASALLCQYNNSTLEVEEFDDDIVKVQSSSDPSNSYTVNLDSLECDCPHFQKIKFAGMVCKHILLANELFGENRSVGERKETSPAPEITVPLILDMQITDTVFYYGSQKLTKRERRGNSHIPSGIRYVLEGTSPEMAIYAIENNDTLLLIGESGVGKSKMIQYFAQETNTPLINACGHNEITVENMLGSLMAINGSTVWKNGILPEAMSKGYWLLLDEINSIDPGVMKVLNELLDNRRITITVAGQPRLVKAHKGFRLICTMNPPDSPIYKGIEMMSFELMDRFETVIYMDYLSPDTEAKLIMSQTGYTDEMTARKIVQFANSIRLAMKQGEIFATVTTRSLISFCKKAVSFDIRTSAETAILRKMSSADRDKALDLFNAIFK